MSDFKAKMYQIQTVSENVKIAFFRRDTLTLTYGALISKAYHCVVLYVLHDINRGSVAAQ